MHHHRASEWWSSAKAETGLPAAGNGSPKCPEIQVRGPLDQSQRRESAWHQNAPGRFLRQIRTLRGTFHSYSSRHWTYCLLAGGTTAGRAATATAATRTRTATATRGRAAGPGQSLGFGELRDVADLKSVGFELCDLRGKNLHRAYFLSDDHAQDDVELQLLLVVEQQDEVEHEQVDVVEHAQLVEVEAARFEPSPAVRSSISKVSASKSAI